MKTAISFRTVLQSKNHIFIKCNRSIRFTPKRVNSGRAHLRCLEPTRHSFEETPRLGFPFFSDFQLPGKRKISKKFCGNFRDSENLRDSENSRDILSSLIVFPFFLVFSISDLIFSILLRCFDKLSFSFSIFSTN